MTLAATRLLLFLLAAGMALASLPFATATNDGACLADASTTSCMFHCNAGDIIHVQVDIYSNYTSVTGSASCGGQSASCTAITSAYAYGWCDAYSSDTVLLPSDMGICNFSGSTTHGYVWCASEPASNSVVYQEVSSESTPQVGGETISTPGVETPVIPSVASPAISTPATCSLNYCYQPGSVGPVATPPVPKTCDPTDLLCVGPGASIPILPQTSFPALCSVASLACVPSQSVLPAGAVQTPGVPAMPILSPSSVAVPVLVGPSQTPGMGVYVNRTIASTDPPQEGGQPVGPFVVGAGGPLPVTVCDTPCNVPYLYGNGWVSVEVSLGGQTYGYTLSA